MSNEFKTIPHLEAFDEAYFETLVASRSERIRSYHEYELKQGNMTSLVDQIIAIGQKHPEGRAVIINNPDYNGYTESGSVSPFLFSTIQNNGDASKGTVILLKTDAERDAEIEASREPIRQLYEQDIANYAQRKRDHLKAQFLAARAEQAAEAQRQRQAEIDRIAAEEAAALEAEVEAYIASQLAPATTAKKPSRKANQEAA